MQAMCVSGVERAQRSREPPCNGHYTLQRMIQRKCPGGAINNWRVNGWECTFQSASGVYLNKYLNNLSLARRYACPQYHNNKDRRRTPKKYKYRSTPCPAVKQGVEWDDPANCDQGDECQCCHTRTEQQFHPEIYKSTKCNDIQQSNYCPRGPFCAFAHSESSGKFLCMPTGLV